MEAIQIVGAGGIGCAIGYALRGAGWPVTMIERSLPKIQSGRQHGIQVDDQPAASAQFLSFDEWNPGEGSVVLLCTKCYDNAAVLQRLPHNVELIPIQNGFDPALEARAHDLEGIASFVSECDRDRPHTWITRPGKLHFGRREESGQKVSERSRMLLASLADGLRKGGLFPVVEVPAINPFKYSKLMYNAAISPLAAGAGIDNGKLLSVPETRRLFFAFLQENYRILSDAGIALGKIGPFHPSTVAAILRRRWVARLLARAFEPSLRGTYCSMAPDLPRGITEIDYYNQRLVDMAGDRPCPLNRAAVGLIKRMERDRIQPNLGVIAELTAVLEGMEEPLATAAATPRTALREP